MWPFKKKKTYVNIGNERIEVKPLSLPQTIELILLLSPYWPVLEDNVPRIEAAIAQRNKSLIAELFAVLRDEMKKAPGDITKLIAILLGVDPRWLAKNGTAQELLMILPTLDKVHNLSRLWRILREGSFYIAG